MRATIKMIAERAGVSIGTVDRVIHGRPYVKAEVRARVLRVMEELDYQPNRMASALAMSGTVRRFAVVQPEWETYIREAMAGGVAQFLAERRDYNVSVEVRCYPKGDAAECLRLLDRAAAEQVHGIALCGSDQTEIRAKLDWLAQRQIPVVTFNSDILQAPRLCYVGEDAQRAGRIAGEIAAKFLRPGDKLLATYAGLKYAGNKNRISGFLERLEERGLRREDCRVAVTRDRYDETLAVVRGALAAEPGLRCVYMANQSVPACIEALRQAGRAGEVRVLSHDDTPEIRQFLREGVVDFSIDQNFAYQSYQALSVLFAKLVEQKDPERDCFYPESPILNAETLSWETEREECEP